MVKNKIGKIAILDSGIGGLSVLKSLVNKYKCGNFIYFADNLYMPYGSLTKSALKKRLNEIINLLLNKYKVDCVVIACNTASSILIKENNDKVYCLEFNKNNTMLGTPLLKKSLSGYKVIADKTLAKQIDNNILNKLKLKQIIKKHVQKNNLNKYSKLCLACTHYELALEEFKNVCGKTEFIKNSDPLIEKLSIENVDLNIIIMLSKQNYEYEQKIRNIIGV